MSKPKVELSLFNRTEAAHYLGVDRGYVNLLIEQGELLEILLPFQTSLKGRRIPKKIIDDFIERKLSITLTYFRDLSGDARADNNDLLNKYLNDLPARHLSDDFKADQFGGSTTEDLSTGAEVE